MLVVNIEFYMKLLITNRDIFYIICYCIFLSLDENHSNQLTELTAGGSNEADIATPTREPVLPPNTDNATPAPDGNAMQTPTHKLRVIPLNEYTCYCDNHTISVFRKWLY
jgi:hypothetical protein